MTFQLINLYPENTFFRITDKIMNKSILGHQNYIAFWTIKCRILSSTVAAFEEEAEFQ